MDDDTRREQGMAVRREVLGNDHVDGAVANTTAFTAPFQDLITRLAWGEIWTRPELDHDTRRLLTIGMLIALNRETELRLHMRAALESGMTSERLKEVVLHSAVYCGVPAANSAFALLAELARETATSSRSG